MTQSISLVIRCLNEEAHIGRLLSGVRMQTRSPDQVVLVDSGSTDATLAIASAVMDIEVVRIHPEDFSFGRALNLGMEAVTSDLAVLASAHVYPVYDTWLDSLVLPLDNDPVVALSYGRQVVPPAGRLSEAQLLLQWFPQKSTPRQHHPFCNNANAAIRTSLWQEMPYDEDLTGLEDLAWAQAALAEGYLLSYVADAPIVHVHDESFSQITNRYRREAIAHRQIFHDQRMSALTAARLGTANIARDLAASKRQGGIRKHARGIVGFRAAQFLGAYQGFAQQGPATELLKRRFYYPSDELAQTRLGESGPTQGNLIDYDADIGQDALSDA